MVEVAEATYHLTGFGALLDIHDKLLLALLKL